MQVQQKPNLPDDKRRSRGIETRKLILNCAISSIASGGLGNTTLDRVAESASVSRGLVVFHFKSKNHLFKEVLEYLGRRFCEGWDEIVENNQNNQGTTMQQILNLVDYDIRFACENPEYISAWHAFWGEAKGNMLYHELSAPRDARYEGELERLLKQYITEEDYDIDINDIRCITDAVSAMLFGFWVESHLDPKTDDYQRGVAAIRYFLEKSFPNKPLS